MSMRRSLFLAFLALRIGAAEHFDEIRFLPEDMRTKASLLKKIMAIQEGQEVAPLELKEGIQRLKNVSQFTVESYRIFKEGKKRVLQVEIDEKWTLMPYLKGSLTGNTKNYAVGLTEGNLFGYLVETGFVYENVAKRSGGSVFAKLPQLFKMPIRYNVDLSDRLKTNSIFDRGSTQIGAFTSEQIRIHAEADYVVSPYFEFGFGMQYTAIYLSEKGLDQSDIDLNKKNNFYITDHDRRIETDFLMNVGKVDTLNLVQQRGTSWTTTLTEPFSFVNSFLSPTIDMTLKRLIPVKYHAQWAARLRAVKTYQRGPYDVLDSAGLSGIRGYSGTQFQGREMMSFNLEYRIPSLQSKWVTLQHTAFVDGLYSRKPFYDFQSPEQRAVSTGLGIRIIIPKIHRLMFRIDYAFAGDPNPNSRFGLSTQQYF